MNSPLSPVSSTVAARARISDFEMSVKGAIVGSVVLTRYNNKTYIVDDVMFDETPKSSFTNSKGETVGPGLTVVR